MVQVLSYDEEARETLLAESIPALLRLAPIRCCRDAAGLISDCSAYHVGFPMLQALGVISGLKSERTFIVQALRRLAEGQGAIPSVLIAGCADFGLLSVVHQAFGTATGQNLIGVIDRCPTPLGHNQEYADRMGFAVETQVGDLTECDFRRRFDVVLAHSVMSFNPPKDRGRIFKTFADALEDGGTVMLYQSIRESCQTPVLAFDDAEVAAKAALAQARLNDRSPRIWDISPDAFHDVVTAFYRTKRTHPVRSVAELVQAAAGAGLELKAADRLFGARGSAHQAATPGSDYTKYEMLFVRR
jgi:hypothetical protein